MDEEHLENFKIDVIECGSKYKGGTHKTREKKKNFVCFACFSRIFMNQ